MAEVKAQEAPEVAPEVPQPVIKEVDTVDSEAVRDAVPQPAVEEAGTVESNPDAREAAAVGQPEVSSAEPATANSVPTVPQPEVASNEEPSAKRPRLEQSPAKVGAGGADD